jgi:hypothetical protein
MTSTVDLFLLLYEMIQKDLKAKMTDEINMNIDIVALDAELQPSESQSRQNCGLAPSLAAAHVFSSVAVLRTHPLLCTSVSPTESRLIPFSKTE